MWDYMGHFEQKLFHNLDKLVPTGRKYAYTVKLNSILTFHGMRDIIGRFKTILKEFNSRNELTKIELRHNSALLGVEDLTNMETDPDFSLTIKEISEEHGISMQTVLGYIRLPTTNILWT
jgi:hypothetical protein